MGLFHIRMGCRKTVNAFAFAFIIILYVNMRTCVDANPVKIPSGTWANYQRASIVKQILLSLCHQTNIKNKHHEMR